MASESDEPQAANERPAAAGQDLRTPKPDLGSRLKYLPHVAGVLALAALVVGIGTYVEKVNALEKATQALHDEHHNDRVAMSTDEKKDTQALRDDIKNLRTQLATDERAASAYTTKFDQFAGETKLSMGRLSSDMTHIADDCFTARFAAVPADQKTAYEALASVGAANVAMTRFVEVRVTEMVNSIFLMNPTEIELSRIESLERVTRAFAGLWDSQPGKRPKIYDVVMVLRDAIDRKKRNTDEGSRAQLKLETILESDSADAYSIAQLLLASRMWSARPGGANAQDYEEAIRHAGYAIKATPRGAAAWNMLLLSRTELAYLQWEKGVGQKTFADEIGELWPQWEYVERYDESQVGHFKYLNNSVYTLALAFRVLADERATQQVPIADFEKSMKRPLDDVIRIGATMAEQLAQGAIDQEGARITVAQFYTGLAMLLRSKYLEPKRSEQLKVLCPALARHKAEDLFEPAWVQFQRVIDTYPTNWSSKTIEDRLQNDELFREWPAKFKERTKPKKSTLKP